MMKNIKNLYLQNSYELTSLWLFYIVVLIVRSIGVSALSDFFTASSNDGLMQLIVSLVLTTMTLTTFVLDGQTLLRRYNKITFIRLIIRFFTGLVFLNAIIYRVHMIYLEARIFHSLFILAFLIETILLIYKHQVSTPKQNRIMRHDKLINYIILLSIVSMLFLTVFQFAGFIGTLVHLVVFAFLSINVGLLLYTKVSGSKEIIPIFLWMILFLIAVPYLETRNIRVHNIYLLGRTVLRGALFFLMFLPLYYHLLEKRNMNAN